MPTIESVHDRLDAIGREHPDHQYAIAEALGVDYEELLADARTRVSEAITVAAIAENLDLHELAGLLIATYVDAFLTGATWGREPGV